MFTNGTIRRRAHQPLYPAFLTIFVAGKIYKNIKAKNISQCQSETPPINADNA
jgi:hypothetical protein